MKKALVAGLTGLTVLMAAPAFAAEPAAAPAAAEKLSVDATPIEKLAAKPETKAILDKNIPQLTSHPAYDQIKGMTLKALQPLAGGALTDAMIAAVQADLDKLPH